MTLQIHRTKDKNKMLVQTFLFMNVYQKSIFSEPIANCKLRSFISTLDIEYQPIFNDFEVESFSLI